MITLGLVELVSACVLMFPEVFGGEGGISGNRVIGEPVLGISYGPQIQVYYLIAGWLLVCAMAICALRHTPLGRILNAVRDNPERAAFIGYDPQRVRYLALILSAFFAGVSGGLSAINFEIVSAEYVARCARAPSCCYLHRRHRLFLRPIVGGVVGVLFSSWLSAYTQAWQFYLAPFFILIVMTTPGGLASLIDRAWHLRYGDIDKRAAPRGCGWQGRYVRWPGSSWPPKWPIRPAWAAWPRQAQVPALAVGAGASTCMRLCRGGSRCCAWRRNRDAHGLASPGGRDDCAGSLDPEDGSRPSTAARSCAASTCNCSPASAVR
jgi:hypothetical protein